MENKVTYSDLRSWAIDWLDKTKGPFPIEGVCLMSTDARVGVQVNIDRIDNTPPNQRKTSRECKAAKRRLIELKKLIEQGPADLSKYGW